MEDRKKEFDRLVKIHYNEFVRTAHNYFGFRNRDAHDFVHDTLIYLIESGGVEKMKSLTTFKGWVFFHMKSLIWQRKPKRAYRMKALIIRAHMLTYLTDNALSYNSGPALLAKQEYESLLKNLKFKPELIELYIRSFSEPVDKLAAEYGYTFEHAKLTIRRIKKKIAEAEII